MKILYLTKTVVGRHGYYRNISLAKGLVKMGHEVALIASSPVAEGGVQDDQGVSVITFPDRSSARVKKGGLSFIDVINRMKYLRNSRFDVVMVDSGFRPVTGIPGHWYARRNNIPYVCEWWDWLGKGGLYDRKSRLYQMTLGLLDNIFEEKDKVHADAVVPLSKKLQERGRKLGIPDERMTILHGGADLSLCDAPDRESARSRMGIPLDANVVGFAGVDGQEVQDLLPFLEAIPELKRRIPNFRWFSTGGEISHEMREKFGIGEEYIEFGWVSYDEYRNCLASADVLLLFQEHNLINEARWPNKLGDYLAAGKPVLATPVGEVVSFAGQYPNHGLCFTGWTSEEVVSSLESLFGDHVRMKEMGRLNREIALKDFSWEKRAAVLSDFLEHIRGIGKD